MLVLTVTLLLLTMGISDSTAGGKSSDKFNPGSSPAGQPKNSTATDNTLVPGAFRSSSVVNNKTDGAGAQCQDLAETVSESINTETLSTLKRGIAGSIKFISPSSEGSSLPTNLEKPPSLTKFTAENFHLLYFQ
jgi:hypothetical protein